MEISTTSRRARRLGPVLEPVVGQVYFSPECHVNDVALGFDPSRGRAGGVALPDGPAYFASRGSVLGQVSGEVVAAAFGVFSAAVVVPAVELAWTRTDAETIRIARSDGAVAQLRRLLGDRPAGAERVRELLQRAAAALPFNGRPMAARSHSCTRGWTTDEFDSSEHRLRDRGYLDGEGADAHLSQQGRHAREQFEVATDEQMAPALDALGGEIEELFGIVTPWGESIRAAHGYLSAGPHDLG